MHGIVVFNRYAFVYLVELISQNELTKALFLYDALYYALILVNEYNCCNNHQFCFLFVFNFTCVPL